MSLPTIFCLTDSLSQDFSKLLIQDVADDFNVSISVGEFPNKKIFFAHSLILRARSPYFRKVLSPRKCGPNEDMITYTLAKPNISPTAFEFILGYIYSGYLTFKETQDNELILNTAIVAAELCLTELCDLLQCHLLYLKFEWVHRNFVLIQNSILRREGLEKLQQHCIDRLKKEPESIFRSPDFIHLNEDIVVSLLKQVNIQMSEIEIWDYILKWGIAQTRMLNDNFGQWSSDDFLLLELSLHNCLPWIRFFHMPYRDFSIKVMPFEKILPKQMVHNVQLYHFVQNSRSIYNILPPRLGLCNSSIITWSHMGLIASWIDRKDCENVLATTVSRVADANKAIYSFVALGPYFGDGDLKVCIRYDSPSCSCTHKSYSSKILEKSDWMVVEEYEVFKVEAKNGNR
ncbi:btb/poz domain-containing protein 19-like [Gigaspora margarita]|uniref:Btb/poz domain-containing protein 19-like n=1 Tax=Gigaspora margarita TaxID=4874 RepID=A0A8H3WU24_GIGMA|nr:btb/poz domain-containing protein 19-like [Gigaspora margarita]